MPSKPAREARTFSIRELCAEFKCTPRSLRFYEAKGLLAPARQGLNRIYSQRDRARLQLILRGKRVNLSLTEIGELLDLHDPNDKGIAQAAAALPLFRAQKAALEQQREDLEAAIATLSEACERLEGQLAEHRADLLEAANQQAPARRDRAAHASAD